MKRKILFLCAGNSARSQMAEAIVNEKYGDKFVAYSAGLNPDERINPYAVKTMAELGIDISDKAPKSLDVFTDQAFDFIITLCNKGAEDCIRHIGKPILAHWGMPDPAKFTGDERIMMRRFGEVLKFINIRVSYLAALSNEKLDRLALDAQMPDSHI